MDDKALIIMAKRPFPGRTKTRLVPPLTEKEAADLYECFLRDTIELVRTVRQATPFLAYTPVDQDSAAYFRRIAPNLKTIPQNGRTLGERLDRVLSSCLARGCRQVVAMNSDSPLLPAVYLQEAFRRLEDPATDVALGPCLDGGYYLIGWKKPHGRLVRDVQMSTEQVLADTLKIAAQENLKVSLLKPWYDVDDRADLEKLQQELALTSSGADHTRQFLARRS